MCSMELEILGLFLGNIGGASNFFARFLNSWNIPNRRFIWIMLTKISPSNKSWPRFWVRREGGVIPEYLLPFPIFVGPFQTKDPTPLIKLKTTEACQCLIESLSFYQPLDFYPPPFKTLCCVYVCDILFLSIFCVNVLRIDLLLKFVFEHFQFPDLRL